MAVHLSGQHDVLNDLVATRDLYAGERAEEEKIAIDRLELHFGDPSGVSLALGRLHALSTVRRRRPVSLLPPRPPFTVNRSAEMETLRQSLIGRQVVDLHGLDGAGKSHLAAALVHDLDLNHFPDGVVAILDEIRYQDLLQVLFDCFYESDVPVKITLQQSHAYLGNLRVLVVLDDLGLGPKQIDPVLDALSEAAVLIVGPERTALGRGRALYLKGLPRQDAVTLFKRALRRELSSDEPLIIDQVCTLLNDMPLPISGVAAQIADGSQTVTKLLTDLQGRKPWAGPGGDLSVGPALEQIVQRLGATDRRLLTLLGAFEGSSVSSEALRSVADLSRADFEAHIGYLRDLALVQGVGQVRQSGAMIPPRLGLSSAYRRTVATWLADDEARREVEDHFATRLENGNRLPGGDLRCLLATIEYCSHSDRLDRLKPLVRAADRSLAGLRWWAEWQHVLDVTRRAAQGGRDRALEAWAMHQLGSALGALGGFERSFHLLGTAVSIRQALGDQSGAALTVRNLEVLKQLVPAPVVDQTSQPATAEDEAQEEAPPSPEQTKEVSPAPPARAGRIRARTVGLAGLAAVVVLLVGALALRFVADAGRSEDPKSDLTVWWEFGDAWNAIDNQTWTQQIRIAAEGGDGDYHYLVGDKPVEQLFELKLPLCDGAQGTIRVESGDGKSAEVEYAFDSPYCP